MFAARVVEAIKVLENSDLNRSACLPRMPPDHLRFDGFEEGFQRGVVIAIARATHPLPGSGLPLQTMREALAAAG